MLSAYYQGGLVAVHRVEANGAVGIEPIDRHETAIGAHAISTDPSNRFTFVPHIARIQDNVLEPPRDNPGPNVIMQFRFDAETGHLSPNSPFRVEPPERLGPRHYCHHPSLDIVYFSNEQGCSVTAYRLDRATRDPNRDPDDRNAPAKVRRPEHLLPDPPDPFGAVPLCRQSRP